MKKAFALMLLCLSSTAMVAQDIASNLIENSIKKGLVLLRQDYQMLNEDDEPVGNKAGQDCYGRTYTCGVCVGENEFLVTKEFVTPWVNESLSKNSKRHPEVSYTGLLTLSTVDFEAIECDVESATEQVANHLYTVGESEEEGFEIDEEYGKKRGFAVWLKSANAFSLTSAPSGLTVTIVPFNVVTKENNYVYDVPAQPTGNVVGGVYIVPRIHGVGSIKLQVNGMFEKRGGVWKLISLGKEESTDNN